MKNLIAKLRDQRFYRSSPLLDLQLAGLYIFAFGGLLVRFCIPVLVVIMFFAVLRIENKIDDQTETLNAIVEAVDDPTGEAIIFEWIRGQLEQLGESE